MKLMFKILLLITIFSNCTDVVKIDTDTYFLEYIDKLPHKSILMSDTLSTEQKQIIRKYTLGVNIPKNFKSITDNKDKECFVFYNSVDNSILLARCFDLTDTIRNQIKRSEKYNSPIYGEDYNDLSEFTHFRQCKKKLTDSIMDPFLFDGFRYHLLGAKVVMHQEFLPKSKKYEFGEFKIFIDDDKYLFVCSLHNGYAEDLNDNARWQAFRFNNH